MLHIMNSLRLMIPGLEIAILLFQLLELFVRVLIWSHPSGLVEIIPVVEVGVGVRGLDRL